MPLSIGIVASHINWNPVIERASITYSLSGFSFKGADSSLGYYRRNGDEAITGITYSLSGFSFKGADVSLGYYRRNGDEAITGITYSLSGASYKGTGARPPGW
jgi:hypothetical protein